MHGSWIRRLTGRGLLRERHHRRALTIGACPRCGQRLEVSTDDWLDAERVVADHDDICEVAAVVEAVPSLPRQTRPILRPA